MANVKRNAATNAGVASGYEAELWHMADALRGTMAAAEYKHVVLGFIFLKYISDAFQERHAAVLAEWGEEAAEDRDEYVAENIAQNVRKTRPAPKGCSGTTRAEAQWMKQ